MSMANMQNHETDGHLHEPRVSRLSIEERSCSQHEGKSSWQIDLCFSDGSLCRSTTITDPATAEDEAELKWYLEKYTSDDPFHTMRAKSVESKIVRYASDLAHSLELDSIPEIRWSDEFDFRNHVLYLTVVTPQDRELDNSSSLHVLHWELLERLDPAELGFQIISERQSLSPGTLREGPTSPDAERSADDKDEASKPLETFRILLVRAREYNKVDRATQDVDVSTVLQELLPIRKTLVNDIDIKVEVVRPGTLHAFSSHLSESSEKHGPNYFQLVHFDVHGMVRRQRGVSTGFLNLAHPSEDGALQPVSAATVAGILQEHQIDSVVLNSCQSARADRGQVANIAETFVANGIAHVVAMAFKLLVSAERIFVKAFYTALLVDGLTVPESTAFARQQLKVQPSRASRYTLKRDLQDWFVPVCYTNGIHTSSSIKRLPKRSAMNDSLNSTPLVGRDADKLSLERHLMESRAIQVIGTSGAGKTALIDDLSLEWQSTDLVDMVVKADFWQCVDYQLTKPLIQAFRSNFTNIPNFPLNEEPGASVLRLLRLVLVHCRIILILDSLDVPFSETIEEHLRQKDPGQFEKSRKAFSSLISSLVTVIQEWGRPSYVIMIGRQQSDLLRMNDQVHTLVGDPFRLSGLSMPAALSLAEKFLNSTKLEGLAASYAETDVLVQVLDMLWRLPGAIKMVLPLANERQSIKDFHCKLVSGDVTLPWSWLDRWIPQVQHQREPERRFPLLVANLCTLDPVVRDVALALAPFWEDGPFNLGDFITNMDDGTNLDSLPGSDLFRHRYTMVYCFAASGYLHLSSDDNVSDIHPLFTLQVRSLAMESNSSLSQRLRQRLPTIIGRTGSSRSGIGSDAVSKSLTNFLREVQSKYAITSLLHHRHQTGMDDFLPKHRAMFANVLRCAMICCKFRLPLEVWPLDLFALYTAPSRLLLTQSEQDTLASAYVDLIEAFKESPGFPVVDESQFDSMLTITTHLAHCFGPHNRRDRYRTEYTDLGLAVIYATEAVHGPATYPALMYKALTFRLRAFDEAIAGRDSESQYWYEEMVKLDKQVAEILEHPPALDRLEQSEEFQMFTDEQQQQSRDNLLVPFRNTLSWQKLRTPEMWSAMMDMIAKSRNNADTDISDESWNQLREGFQSVYQVHEQTGVAKDLSRWEEVFPRDLDLKAYGNRFVGDGVRAAGSLEHAIGLSDWTTVAQAHDTMYKESLRQGNWVDAVGHLNEQINIARSTGRFDPKQSQQFANLVQTLSTVVDSRSENDGVPTDQVAAMLRAFAEVAETSGNAQLEHLNLSETADIIEKDGDATEEEAEKVQRTYDEMHKFAPWLPAMPEYSWIEHFHRQRQAKASNLVGLGLLQALFRISSLTEEQLNNRRLQILADMVQDIEVEDEDEDEDDPEQESEPVSSNLKDE